MTKTEELQTESAAAEPRTEDAQAAEPPEQAVRPVREVSVTRLEQARALPEVGPEAELVPCVCTAIARFKSEDGRTMRVVLTRDGLAAQEVLDIPAGTEAAIALLDSAAEQAEHNAGIHAAEGRPEEAAHARATAASFRQAIRVLQRAG